MSENFTRSESAPLKDTIDIIEKLLNDWKIDPASVKDGNRNAWFLEQGSAKFHIELFQFNKGADIGEVDCIEIGGIIMKMPEDNFLPLYRRLLELNSTSVGVYFSIREDLVMLLSTREVAGMDYNELKTLVDEVRLFSDYWDNILMEEFGGKK